MIQDPINQAPIYHSALYQGVVMHRRYRPKLHQFRYSLFMIYLDLEELPYLFRPYWLWSYEKFNWASFWRRDHVGDPKQSLADYIRGFVQNETGLKPEGPIRLLTHLRFLGYCFNPVSFYYIFNPEDTDLDYIVAEVCNTPWGERHCYLLHPGNQEPELKNSYRIQKKLHVSPFMTMDYEYQIQFNTPGSELVVTMRNFKNKTLDFEAQLVLKKQDIRSRNLAKVLIKHPAMTIKIISAIYWQAFKLFLKRVPFISHPKNKNSQNGNSKNHPSS